MKMTSWRRWRFRLPRWDCAIAVMPTVQRQEETRYQRLRVRVVSAMGAQKNFQMWNMPEAMSSAPVL